MSAVTMGGSDAVKASQTNAVAGSKQQLKGSSNGKALDGARKQAASPVDGQNRKQQPPQPKAWQGPNPITQRASTSTPNGTEKPLPKTPVQSRDKSLADSNADKHAHDRALYIIANFIGNDATLTLKNGEQFTGVFSGGSFEPNSKPQYTLKMVKRARLPTSQQVNGNTELPSEYIGEGEDHVMVFDQEDTVDLAVPDVVPAAAHPMQNGSINSSFRTDTEISARDSSLPRERELQRWEPGPDSNIDLSLEGTSVGEWDQFATNEARFGVTSTWDEEFYTTAINKNDPNYKQKSAAAARTAREIESSLAGNAHVAEERRQDADRGDGLDDEEEKYSGVRRDVSNLPKRAAGAYVPPSQRPLTNAPTVHGAPFDPAIISMAKAPAPNASEIMNNVGKVAATSASTEDQAGAAPEAISTDETKDTAPTVQVPKNTAEDHVRNVTDSFKQFANNEKLRMRAAQEAKRQGARAEKNVKLNDLKKFAANFKLKSRVPDDLVPILAKDREKQIEIQHKADEAYKEEEVKSKERDKEKVAGAASPAPSSSSISQANTVSADQRVPFNAHSRARVSQNPRSGPILPNQPQATRQPPLTQQQTNRAYNRPNFPPPPQPLPVFPIATGPAAPPLDAGPLSPTSAATRLSAKAFEFRPAASTFTPSGTSPSPQRATGSAVGQIGISENAPFQLKEQKDEEKTPLYSAFNPIQRMLSTKSGNDVTANGGIPRPFKTNPTWETQEANMNKSYRDEMQKPQVPSQGVSPMHTPNPNVQMPHAHQLPPHLQAPQVSTPSQRPPYMAPPQHYHPQGGYDPRMQAHFGPNGSVQSSPRFPPAQVAFNGQMQGMPMPQFAGQQMPHGMSPSMQYRQPVMPQGGQMQMMPNQMHGQMPQMPQGYPRGGPQQQFNPQMMGGVPMANQHSGSFMGGPMPQNTGYSPMPPHAQPHMPHMQQGYTGSPRPYQMQHTHSHQGFGQQGPMHMQHPPFAPSPGQHPYHMNQRQMSAGAGGYPQMTPRQQHSMPQHPSPGMAGGVPAQGDEGK